MTADRAVTASRDLSEARRQAEGHTHKPWAVLDVSAGWLSAHDYDLTAPPPCDLCPGSACGPDLTPGLSIYYGENASVEHHVGSWIARLCQRCVDHHAVNGIDLPQALTAFNDAGREEDRVICSPCARSTEARVRLAEAKTRAGRQLIAELLPAVLVALGVDTESIRRGLTSWTRDERWVNKLLAELDPAGRQR